MACRCTQATAHIFSTTFMKGRYRHILNDNLPGKGWGIRCWTQPNGCTADIHIITTTQSRSTLTSCYFINPIMLCCMSVITTTSRFLRPIISQDRLHYLPNPQKVKSWTTIIALNSEVHKAMSFRNHWKSVEFYLMKQPKVHLAEKSRKKSISSKVGQFRFPHLALNQLSMY